MSERTLASIQKVVALFPIEGRDRIELAQIEGWKVIVSKGLYKPGDLLVYFEIDSVLPKEDPRWATDLERYNFRVRTMKMAGVYSQGYTMPLSELTAAEKKKAGRLTEGKDLTEVLKVEKYEPNPDNVDERKPKTLFDKLKKHFKFLRPEGGVNPYLKEFPYFIPKTDETRIEKKVKVLQTCYGAEFSITEKLDGSSMTVYHKDGKFGVCSRNKELLFSLPPLKWWQILLEKISCGKWKARREPAKAELPSNGHFCKTVVKLDLFRKLEELKRNIAVQGELVGPDICGNKYKLKETAFYPFYVYDLDRKQYLNFDETMLVIGQLGLNFVPLLEERAKLGGTVDDWKALSHGQSKIGPVIREGIVLRSNEAINGSFESFKVVDPVWLDKFKA